MKLLFSEFYKVKLDTGISDRLLLPKHKVDVALDRTRAGCVPGGMPRVSAVAKTVRNLER